MFDTKSDNFEKKWAKKKAAAEFHDDKGIPHRNEAEQKEANKRLKDEK